jgi:hypothetical protein
LIFLSMASLQWPILQIYVTQTFPTRSISSHSSTLLIPSNTQLKTLSQNYNRFFFHRLQHCSQVSYLPLNFERFHEQDVGMEFFGLKAQRFSDTYISLSKQQFKVWICVASSLRRLPELIYGWLWWPAAYVEPCRRWIYGQFAWYEPLWEDY